MSIKENIKNYLLENNNWISTRQLRETFGEAADRRLRELKGEGVQVEHKRSIKPNGKKGFTYFWRLKTS
jgi:predicted DNA-binding ArsR family transcriptional regulator